MHWPDGVTAFKPQESLKAVVAGLGSVQQRLAAVLAAEGVQRPMIVCGANLATSPAMATVVAALGAEPLIYSGSRPHTPLEAVDAGAAAARAGNVDGFIALGGSSAIDCAKGIAVLTFTGNESVKDLEPADFGRLGESRATSARQAFPFISLTTTLSFAEFMPFWGARHAEMGRKLPYSDQDAVRRTIFLDGELAAHTPDGVWVETGIKALDDALSAFCRGDTAEPFLDPILSDAIAALDEWLPRSMGPDQAAARQQVLTATWMTKMALPRVGPATVSAWFSTAARHALGGAYELPHGIGSCVSLGVGLQHHAAATRGRQELLAARLGWPVPGDPTASPLLPGLTSLFGRLGVPTKLSQLGVDAARFDGVVANIINEAPQLGTPDEIRELCQQML